jgi:hypothetical protein
MTGSLHPLLPTIPLTIPYDDIPSAGGLGKSSLVCDAHIIELCKISNTRIKLTSIHPRQRPPPILKLFLLSGHSPCLRIRAYVS